VIISVTPIGDSSGSLTPVEIGRRVAAYLQGVGLDRGGHRPGRSLELPSLSGEGTVAYYADSTGIRPGRWLGERSGEVDSVELTYLVAGVDPDTNEVIETSPHGSGPRRPAADLARLEDGPEWYTADAAASVLGVSSRYLRRLAQRAADTRAGAVRDDSQRSAGVRCVAQQYIADGLIARTGSGSWLFHRDAIAALGRAREPDGSVYAYDVTMSFDKAVSLIWARGDDDVRANVLAAIDEASAAAVRYLERHALYVRVGAEQHQAASYTAAEFLHLTSRALDPQLHKHLLLLNRAADEQGNVRALDGRLLFLHAKTAGYLASAELRHQLAARLGIEHGPSRRGIARLLGVSDEVTREFSTRSREIAEATAALGVDSPSARQVAAYDTRAAKEKGIDFEQMTSWWQTRMHALGFTDEHLRSKVLGRVAGPRVFREREREAMFSELSSLGGITANEARFDRRAVVRAVAERAGESCSAEAIENLTDAFLARDDVVRLEQSRDTSSAQVIRRADGRAVVVPLGESYSTRAMLATERAAIAGYLEGLHAGAGVVPAEVLGRVLAEERFAHLSAEQQRFVEELTSSGRRVQAGLGRAGTGKTTALEAATAAWRAGGYEVLGAAVGGSQAVLLGEQATGESATVAAILSRHEAGDGPITSRTIVLVDEASLLSTRDAAALQRAVAERSGAALRLIGDDHQHGAVAAGGFFRYLVERRRDEVPELSTNHRQQGEEMAEVRLALEEYRAGKITEALQRLERDGHITEASSVAEAYDLLTCAWYAERQRRLADPSRELSSMTAEHHHERRELNTRARAMLKADGTLHGPELVVDGVGFQAGDEVIARLADHELRAENAGRDRYVRNGSRGVVRQAGADRLLVSFERWGEVAVSRDYIEREVSPGVRGGLMHAYALTTYAAQGATMSAGLTLLSDASSREGAYVALTRPRLSLSAIAIRAAQPAPPAAEHELPVVVAERSELEATAAALQRDRRERLASELDPLASRAQHLARTLKLNVLEDLLNDPGEDHALFERALRERLRLVGLRGVSDPSPDVEYHLGPRPSERAERSAWDAAAGVIAIYRERERPDVLCNPRGIEWALGRRPSELDAGAEYDELAALIEPVVSSATSQLDHQHDLDEDAGDDVVTEERAEQELEEWELEFIAASGQPVEYGLGAPSYLTPPDYAPSPEMVDP
jgi:conjugative relaxase-like TrwC/TraI family protein